MLTGPRLTGDMPILGNPGMLPVPGGVIAPHETRARINHGQTLGRLKQRGGLSVSEVVAILEDRPWRRMGEIQAVDRLAEPPPYEPHSDEPASTEPALLVDEAERPSS